jgi:hypothetical protein
MLRVTKPRFADANRGFCFPDAMNRKDQRIMSNTNTTAPTGADRELALLLGTFWFDFEQAAELGNAALGLQPEPVQPGEPRASDARIPEYAI